MQNEDVVQLSKIFNKFKPNAVLNEIYKIFTFYYPPKFFKIVKKSYQLIEELYSGNFPGYKKCNTEYHNFDHVLDVILAIGRIVDGYNLTKRKMNPEMVVNLILGALFHDTGYIQEINDDEGTGAKYTKSHIERSINFLMKHHEEFQIQLSDAQIIVKLIGFTGNITSEEITSMKDEEKMAGCILGTADLIGQMADRQYLERLIFLYYEFKEAEIEGFNEEFDILNSLLEFYKIMKDKLSILFLGVNNLTKFHFKQRYQIERDLYEETIDRHIKYVESIIHDDDKAEFRKRLKRIDFLKAFDKSSSKEKTAEADIPAQATIKE
jgi:hypothetical protein